MPEPAQSDETNTMTFQLVNFYCHRCRTGTPHEFDSETQKSRCVICTDKEIRHAAQKRLAIADEIDSFIAALDGAGDRDPHDRGPRSLRKETPE
jgi:hypothetical protein